MAPAVPSLSPSAERERLRRAARGATRERMLRELADVEAITAEVPLMIVLEDLHWSDYSTLDLIGYLARRRDPARLIVVGTYRPVDVILGEHPLKAVKRELQAHGLCQELPLEYLTERPSSQYLAATLPGHQFPKWLARLIHRRTEGNPLFMVNLVEYLIDEQHHRQAGRGLAAARWGRRRRVRHSRERQATDRTQIDRLTLTSGACSRARAWWAWSARRSPSVRDSKSRPNGSSACEALVRRHQFLSPPRLVELPDGTITPRYKFGHVLYLEVPYRLLPPCGGHRSTGVSATAARRSTGSGRRHCGGAGHALRAGPRSAACGPLPAQAAENATASIGTPRGRGAGSAWIAGARRAPAFTPSGISRS